MSDAINVAGTGGGAGGAPAAVEPPKTVEPPKAEPPAAAKPVVEPPKAAEPPKAEPPAAAEADAATVADDDDDEDSLKKIVDKDGHIRMPYKSFKTRIQRADKASLKKIFGTDDRDAIIKLKNDYEQMLQERENSRRAQMKEDERLREDLKKAEERASAAEKRHEEYQLEQEIDRSDRAVNTKVAKQVKAEYLDDAVSALARHVVKLGAEGAEGFGEKEIDDWLKEQLEKKPAWSAEAKEPVKVEPAKVEPTKKPLTTGGTVAKPAAAPTSSSAATQGKTASPGKQNSMTSAEYQAYLRERGIQY